jgi:hypothetical protein
MSAGSSLPGELHVSDRLLTRQEQDQNPEGNAMSFDNIFYSVLQVTIIASSAYAS